MGWIVMIGSGFFLILMGIIMWGQSHTIEKHLETRIDYYIDSNGITTRINNGTEFFKKYRIIEKEVAK